MPRFLRAVPASILAVLLFVSGVGFAHDVPGEPSAWNTISTADAHPSLHSSASTPRVDVRQHRRTTAGAALLLSVAAYDVVVGVASPATFGPIPQRGDRSIEARGYDATAPPRALS